MSKPKIDLTAFCHPFGTGYAIGEPFVRDGYLVATDGRVMVRIKTDQTDTESRRVPKTDEIFARSLVYIETREIATPEFGEHSCCECGGKATLHAECDTCGGDGEHGCECGNNHECGHCSGSGRIECDSLCKCEVCQGTGRGYKNLSFGGKKYTGKYIALITRKLGNPKAVGVDAGGVLKFEFDGGEGILMCRPDDEID